MKKFVAFATVGTLGFFVGGLWTCIRICEMVDAGIDVNSIVKDCIRAGAAKKEGEVRISKWRRKYSEVHR